MYICMYDCSKVMLHWLADFIKQIGSLNWVSSEDTQSYEVFSTIQSLSMHAIVHMYVPYVTRLTYWQEQTK